MITVHIEGVENILSDIDKFTTKHEDAVSRGLSKIAFLASSISKRKILSGQKTGRRYKRGEKSYHTASAAGEPPANDTGRLASSIVADSKRMESTFSANVDYASHLEYGTKKMQPRPFMRPSASEAAEKGIELIKDELERM